MEEATKFTLWRMLPIILLAIAAALWFNEVQNDGRYVLRNLVPIAILVLLCWVTLRRGRGEWTGAGKRLPLGLIGFAIPALGLSLYLHYAYSVNLNEMFSDAEFPDRVFRYLPYYTSVAGGIGFAIGWIVGRNV
jgi:hypothetical protein